MKLLPKTTRDEIHSFHQRSGSLILHRQLRGLLRQIGLGGTAPPDQSGWESLLASMNDAFRAVDEERLRLQRSLDFHRQELQSLYQELVSQREQLQLMAAASGQAFILCDAAGAATQISPEAALQLGFNEHDPEAATFLHQIGLEALLGSADLNSLLRDGEPVQARGSLRRRNGETRWSELQIFPLLREHKLLGALLIVRSQSSDPGPHQWTKELEEIQWRSSLLLEWELSPELELCARSILSKTELALEYLNEGSDSGEKTLEELPQDWRELGTR